MNQEKRCTKCNEMLPVGNFGKRKNGFNGLNAFCKSCESMRQLNHSRTKIGLSNATYSHQVQSSKRRGYKMPEYSLQELRKWMFSNSKFDILYSNWVNSGYDKNLYPSSDRKDDQMNYTLDNIQLMTWRENNLKGYKDKRLGKINNCHELKPVLGTSINDNTQLNFISMMDAERNGFKRSSIRKCCNGKQKYHKGYCWEWNSRKK